MQTIAESVARDATAVSDSGTENDLLDSDLDAAVAETAGVTEDAGVLTKSIGPYVCQATVGVVGSRFEVTVDASCGGSAPSALAAPGAPVGVSVVPGHQSATVSWSPTTSDGGSPITGYVVTATPGGTSCSTASTSCTLTGLTDGVSYTVGVVASNVVGASASVASAAFVPTAPPSAAGAAFYASDVNVLYPQVAASGTSQWIAGACFVACVAPSGSLAGPGQFVAKVSSDGSPSWHVTGAIGTATSSSTSGTPNGLTAAGGSVYTSGYIGLTGSRTGYFSTSTLNANMNVGYVVALDADDGSTSWVVMGESSGHVFRASNDADGSNLVVGGKYRGSGASGFLAGLPSTGGSSLDGGFVAVLSPADGSLVWNEALTATGEAEILDVAIGGGQVYVTGHYNGVPAGIGAGWETASVQRAFLAALDATSGTLAWSVTFPADQFSSAASADFEAGLVAVGGRYQGDATFGSLPTASSMDAWASVLEADGDALWTSYRGTTTVAETGARVLLRDGTVYVAYGTGLAASGIGWQSGVSSQGTDAVLVALGAYTGVASWTVVSGGAGGSSSESFDALAANDDGVWLAGILFMGASPRGYAAEFPNIGTNRRMWVRIDG